MGYHTRSSVLLGVMQTFFLYAGIKKAQAVGLLGIDLKGLRLLLKSHTFV